MDASARIGLLGDSTTTCWYLYEADRWDTKLRALLPDKVVYNHGVTGSKAEDFATGGAYPPSSWLVPGATYVVRFGWNETVLLDHQNAMDSICDSLDAAGCTVFLAYQYPSGYPTYNNTEWALQVGSVNAYMDTLAAARGYTIIDLNTDFEAGATTYDVRIRAHGIASKTADDPDVWGPASPLDGDGFGGAFDIAWYSNIHPNPAGCTIIAARIATALGA